MTTTRLVGAFTTLLGLTLTIVPWPAYGLPHSTFDTIAATLSMLFTLTVTVVGVLIWVGAGTGDP